MEIQTQDSPFLGQHCNCYAALANGVFRPLSFRSYIYQKRWVKLDGEYLRYFDNEKVSLEAQGGTSGTWGNPSLHCLPVLLLHPMPACFYSLIFLMYPWLLKSYIRSAPFATCIDTDLVSPSFLDILIITLLLAKVSNCFIILG